MGTVTPFPRERQYEFESRMEYAHCLNCQIRVLGTEGEGVIAVYATGIGHVGEEIELERIGDAKMAELTEELLLHIAETRQEAAEALADERAGK
jgi:hypothetical protein